MLTFDELRKANVNRNKQWDPEGKIDLGFRAAEFGGEAGELLNCIKKKMREALGLRGSRTTPEAIAEELADVVICADLLGMALDIDLSAAVRAKFNDSSIKNGFEERL